ncbi:MAG: hypothetical protein AAF658_06935, partial [Myxococcota bacterium]
MRAKTYIAGLLWAICGCSAQIDVSDELVASSGTQLNDNENPDDNDRPVPVGPNDREPATSTARPTVPLCGNGIREGDEFCDDGDRNSDEWSAEPHCNNACDALGPFCGDGSRADGFEACDDSGESPMCNADCSVATCGDGVRNVSAGEACDAGSESESCNADCTEVACGDGIINAAAGETCEQGGVNTLTCDADCTDVACGDGFINDVAGETCDDGNNTLTDACPDGASGTCQPALCGDGIVWSSDGGPEQCDSFGEDSLNCDRDCSSPECGDGLVNAVVGEGCDDGNKDNSDQCPDGPQGSCASAFCGDGFAWTTDGGGEDCDDGSNGDDTDFCTDACVEIPQVCGDGSVTGDEACDDSNTVSELPTPVTDPDADYVSGEGCVRDCSVDPSQCHDGVLDPGEECDLGVDPGDNLGSCTRSCQRNDFDIGAACTSDAGVDEPNYSAGNIVGCDNVPVDFDPDCALGCLRSISSPSGDIFYPGGYCSLYAIGCSGIGPICSA